MKKILLVIIMLIVTILVIYKYSQHKPTINNQSLVIEKPLDKYTYQALKNTVFTGSQITIDKMIKDEEQFTSYLFYYKVNNYKISGLMNIPKQSGNYPVIIMIRGYVDRNNYVTGIGTSHGGEVMAKNGFITLAPDYLGYGSSDNPPINSLEDRFLSYVSTIELIKSLNTLNQQLTSKSIKAQYDNNHIGIWGHSNGGQIALSVIEITGEKYPTVLWAPVSKPFPYSILYYTDDIDDHGKALRKVIANFESNYDIEKYSLTNYFDWIKAPIQIHQGSNDEAVPISWSDSLNQTLNKKKKEVEYFTYVDDHNFSQGNWNLVIQRTMEFYNQEFGLTE